MVDLVRRRVNRAKMQMAVVAVVRADLGAVALRAVGRACVCGEGWSTCQSKMDCRSKHGADIIPGEIRTRSFCRCVIQHCLWKLLHQFAQENVARNRLRGWRDAVGKGVLLAAQRAHDALLLGNHAFNAL